MLKRIQKLEKKGKSQEEKTGELKERQCASREGSLEMLREDFPDGGFDGSKRNVASHGAKNE